MAKRTHHCAQLRIEDVGQTVTLAGWVNSYRDHGGVIFIDLRDREGLTQLVFRPGFAEAHALADRLRNEDVVEITGVVEERGVDPESGKSLANPKLPTGEIEVAGHSVILLNKAQTPPFTPDDANRTNEETRLRYRYVDLRRPRMQQIVQTRHRVTKVIRDYFDEQGFCEIETPFLCRSTPEGARDFLVPSRVHAGSFYALPQSPQLFKQILMVGGVDKYVQIVRCFRDEDPRADRVAEFTQLDLEMSFVQRDDVMQISEGMARRVWKQVADIDVPDVPHMSFEQAMNEYGSDRPDVRFELKLIDVGDIVKETDFKVFRGALDEGGMVKAIRVPGGGKLTRKQTDGYAEWVKQFGVGGLPVTKVVAGGALETGVAKFVSPVASALIERTGAQEGDLLCFGVHSKPSRVHKALGELRLKIAEDLDMIDANQRCWLWVVDFPLVEWNEDEGRWDALHHPFTAPFDEDLDKLETDPGSVRSKAYDLVLNGSELGGGSIRIHQPELQQRIFSLLGITPEQARGKFGFLLDALKYGAPPHGGLAFGLDRMLMHIVGTDNIRDVIAFPKTQTGADLMTDAPSEVDMRQLEELRLKVIEPAASATTPTP